MARTVGLTFEDKTDVPQEVITTNTEVEEVKTVDEKPKKETKEKTEK